MNSNCWKLQWLKICIVRNLGFENFADSKFAGKKFALKILLMKISVEHSACWKFKLNNNWLENWSGSKFEFLWNWEMWVTNVISLKISLRNSSVSKLSLLKISIWKIYVKNYTFVQNFSFPKFDLWKISCRNLGWKFFVIQNLYWKFRLLKITVIQNIVGKKFRLKLLVSNENSSCTKIHSKIQVIQNSPCWKMWITKSFRSKFHFKIQLLQNSACSKFQLLKNLG